MKKLMLGTLVAGLAVLPLGSTEAYHVIKPHRPMAVERPVAQELQAEPKATKSKEAPMVKNYNKGAQPEATFVCAYPAVDGQNKTMSATASARTDRKLLSEDTPASVYSDTKVQTSAPVQASQGEYLMRSGDQLQIVVYGHEDLSTRPGVSYTPYVVRPDGMLAMPLIGDVNCQGKTVPQVTQEITNRLAEYIIDPQVTINITKLGTTRVYVLGEVRQQGLFELDKSHNLIDAVAKAGGFTQKSAKRKVYVVRQGMDNFVTQVNLVDLMKKGNLNGNVELQEGDCVYISSNHKIGLQAIFNAIYSIANTVERIDDVRN